MWRGFSWYPLGACYGSDAKLTRVHERPTKAHAFVDDQICLHSVLSGVKRITDQTVLGNRQRR